MTVSIKVKDILFPSFIISIINWTEIPIAGMERKRRPIFTPMHNAFRRCSLAYMHGTFDSIWQKYLTINLKSLGIDGLLLELMCDYLIGCCNLLVTTHGREFSKYHYLCLIIMLDHCFGKFRSMICRTQWPSQLLNVLHEWLCIYLTVEMTIKHRDIPTEFTQPTRRRRALWQVTIAAHKTPSREVQTVTQNYSLTTQKW